MILIQYTYIKMLYYFYYYIINSNNSSSSNNNTYFICSMETTDTSIQSTVTDHFALISHVHTLT